MAWHTSDLRSGHTSDLQSSHTSDLRSGRTSGIRSGFLPFSPPAIGEEEIAEVTATLRTPWISTGPKVAEFESAFADFVGADSALGMSSCTDALQVALAALGVGPGDAVFTTTMTFCATAHVVEHLGARPILVDVLPDTLNIDVAALAEAVERVAHNSELRPRAVMPVHFAGEPVDMEAIATICRRYEMALVEDAAHALPASWGGHRVGSMGDLGVPRAAAFSFYATKNLTTGEGGMLTATPDLLNEARLWSLHGMSRDAWNRYGQGGSWRYDVVRPGFKGNMTDIAASLGLVQLRRLPEFHRRRLEIVHRYDRAFGDESAVEVPTGDRNGDSAWHLYTIRLDLEQLSVSRDGFIDEMAARNIGCSVHFTPVHQLSYYEDRYGFAPESFPVASNEFRRLVSLPLHPLLTDDDVEDVTAAVIDTVEAFRR